MAVPTENWLWYISDHAAFECSRLWSHKYYGEEQGQGISTVLAWILTSESVSIIKWLFFAAFIVQLLSHIWPCNTNAAHQALLSSNKSQSLIKFMSIELVMPSNNLTSAYPFSFCFQSFPASESFPLSWLFTWSGHSIGASASASLLPKNIQGWFPIVLTGLISLLPKGFSRVFLNTTV